MLRVQCFVWRFVVSILSSGNGQSDSRDRKSLIGCYWKYYEYRNFYQISWITIIVIFFRRTCWIYFRYCYNYLIYLSPNSYAIQICLFICLFTLYLLLTKKANNDLLNKYVKYNYIWLQIIVHNWLILVNYQLKNKIWTKILVVLRDQT